MADGGITVSGGAGGVTAGYDDMIVYAGRLDVAGDGLTDTSRQLTGLLADGDILAAAVLCPGEVAGVETSLGAVAARTLADAAQMEVQARYLRTSVTVLRETDEALAAAADVFWDTAGTAIGMALPGLAITGVAVVATNPLLAGLLIAHRDQLGPMLQQTLYDHPWLQEALTRSAPGLVQGFAQTVLGGPVTGTILMAALTGGQWPSGDYTTSVAGLMTLANRFGVLEDSGTFSTSPVEGLEEVAVEIDPASPVASIFEQQRVLSRTESAVQVIALSNGSYIVEIPGTQEWGPTRGDNPVDLTTNVALMAGRDSVMEAAVADAMHRAGIPSDAPVMLAGHSQGGITAASLASDPSFRDSFNVQSVLTGGSPIARTDIPDDISVLSMEHGQDPVPRLDGLDNPDRPDWITVRRDVPDADGTTAAGVRDPFQAHGADNYVVTGQEIDASDDASLQQWREDNATFFGSGQTTTYEISRTP